MNRDLFSYVYDGVHLSPGAAMRPARRSTEAAILHKIGADRLRWVMHEQEDIPSAELYDMTDLEIVVAFFTRSPEGVATVTLPGSYGSKIPAIQKWRRRGIPARNLAAAFVPYEFLIDKEGAVTRLLLPGTRGAHTRGYSSTSIGVAYVGDFERDKPTGAQVKASWMLMPDLRHEHPGLKVLGHDEAREAKGRRAKGCPGRHFPVKEIAGSAGVS